MSQNDGCAITSQHVNNTHADHRPQGVLVRKDKAVSRNKIDAVMSSALAHEAALDATAAKVPGKRQARVYANIPPLEKPAA